MKTWGYLFPERLKRGEYFGRTLIGGGAFLAFNMVVASIIGGLTGTAMVAGDTSTYTAAGVIPALLITGLHLAFIAYCMTLRLRDAGKGDWWAIAWLVVYVIIILATYLNDYSHLDEFSREYRAANQARVLTLIIGFWIFWIPIGCFRSKSKNRVIREAE